MADRKITDLTALAAGSQATGDLLTIVDVSESAAADKNKSITVENMFKGIPGDVGIGVSSPNTPLAIASNASTYEGVELVTPSGDGSGVFTFGVHQSGSTAGRTIAFARGGSDGHDTESLRIDASGRLLVGTTTVPTGLVLGNSLTAASSTGAEVVAFRSDTSVAVGDKCGAFVIGNSDTDGAEDHFVGMWGKAASTNGSMDLHFAAGRASYEGDTPDVTIKSGGNVGIGVSAPSATLHAKSGTTDVVADFESTDANAWIQIRDNSTTDTAVMVGAVGDDMRLRAGSNERVRIDSDGNVGIGTTSPGARLEVKGSASAGYAAQFTNSTESRFAKIYVDGNGIAFVDDNFDDGIEFASNTARIYAGGAERMRIDSSGRLMVGTTTSKSTAGKLQAYTSSGDLNLHIQSDGLASGNAAYLNVNAKKSGGSTSYNAQLGLYKHSGINDVSAYLNLSNLSNRFMWNDSSGNFRTSTSAAHIGTTSGTVVGTQTSDERLKNVGADVAYGLTEVKQLQTKQYALRTDPDTNKLGFIAQQVESIIPEAVFDTNEELDGHQEGDRTKLGMEYVQLIPVLVNAIKELSAEVDTLKTKVAALEAG